ncbi:MAG: hypothetical protein AAB131_10600, partial [Actinomycetota bacterium]
MIGIEFRRRHGGARQELAFRRGNPADGNARTRTRRQIAKVASDLSGSDDARPFFLATEAQHLGDQHLKVRGNDVDDVDVGRIGGTGVRGHDGELEEIPHRHWIGARHGDDVQIRRACHQGGLIRHVVGIDWIHLVGADRCAVGDGA